MFRQLQKINHRPVPFEFYSAEELWTDEHRSSKMLACHLDDSIDLSSRKSEFIDRSVAWIVDRFELSETKRVADFGCGPGLYTTRLAASGSGVTGIDFSARSIQHARQQAERQGLSINHVHANYLGWESSTRFDLIMMIMCDFCALSPEQRQILLNKFSALLVPGGAVLLDVYSHRAFDDKGEDASYGPELLDGFWSPEPYFGFLNTFKYLAEKVVLDKYTIVEETRTYEAYNWLQHYDTDALESELGSVGLVVEEFLGNVAGETFDPSSQEFAVIARKGGVLP